MKKTFTINISGIIFHIDEDAYEVLLKYLNEINRKFASSAEGREIISDIEARIAELFQEKVSDIKQVITIDDVNAVIEVMGKPEEMIEEEDEQHNEKGKRKNKYKTGKRMYRDPDNRVLGGVCSGLGAYFGIDPIIVRVLLIASFFISGPIIYIILWIIIPEAKTTAQKLEMKGEKINVENIEKSIKDEFKNVKENFNDIKNSNQFEKSKNGFDRFLSVVFGILSYTFRVLMIIIGSVFVIVGLFFLIGFTGSLFIESWGVNNFSIPVVLKMLFDDMNVFIGLISLIIVVGIPVLAIIYAGIKMIFRIKGRSKIVGMVAFFTWIFGLILLTYAVLNEVKNHQNSSYVENLTRLDTLPANTLYLKLSDNKLINEELDDKLSLSDMIIANNKNGEVILCGTPNLKIRSSKKKIMEVEIIKKANGLEERTARNHAREIEYSWNSTDSIIYLDKYFALPLERKWFNQDMTIILHVPEGQELEMDKGILDLMQRYYYYDFEDNKVNNKYIITEEGLELIDENKYI